VSTRCVDVVRRMPSIPPPDYESAHCRVTQRSDYVTHVRISPPLDDSAWRGKYRQARADRAYCS